MSARFSICIPYHKNEAYLREAVASVAAQSLDDFELLLSLDNPISDETRQQVLDQVRHCRILDNPDPGISGNWNHCVRMATGHYTTLLHGDDQLAPDYLSTMAELIAQHPAAAWFCDVELIDARGQSTRTLADAVKPWLTPRGTPIVVSGDAGLAGLLRGCYIFNPTLCYRSDIIKRYRFSREWDMTLDLELYWRILRDGQHLVGTQQRCYRYRRHAENQTAQLTHNTARFHEEWALYNQISRELSDGAGWPKSLRQSRHKYLLRLHLLYDTMKGLLRGRTGDFSNRLKLLLGR